MKKTALYLGSLVAAAVFLTGCSDESPFAPHRGPGPSYPRPGSEPPAAEQLNPALTRAATANRAPELPTACAHLQVTGGQVAYHVYAEGVQIYRWNGTSWAPVGPAATLSADAGGNSKVGIHYGGPTWESNSGSKVIGEVAERCSPNPNAIPWLKLRAKSSQGPGVFDGVTFIQRVNTVGGNAPATPGSFAGEDARVSYATEYYFYR